jgi:hypothetical protein
MPKYPHLVIFLPGIMGSAFRDQCPVEFETVWSPFKLFIKSYERITVMSRQPRSPHENP